MEPQLENIVVKLTAETSLVAEFPLSIYDFKRNVLVRWPRVKPQRCKVRIVRARCQEILWRRILIDQIRIENIELVSLNDFRRRIIHIVVSLVILVPFEASVDTIEVTRLPRTILVRPQVDLRIDSGFDGKFRFIIVHSSFCFLAEDKFVLRKSFILLIDSQHFLSKKIQHFVVFFLGHYLHSRFQVTLRNVFWLITTFSVQFEAFIEQI
ncbi:AAEL013169-PA [Aedes aegypti]|uniref:AAEL013169-PA n=1 Tax=Aedes aegypti TaxID=7159 RepID=Q16JZ3_AEDAE|nr:AAEL013169-PA [Aedes aegypti]